MALPSFSLQSTSVLSDLRWVLELSSISVCLGWSWGLCLGKRAREGSGL